MPIVNKKMYRTFDISSILDYKKVFKNEQISKFYLNLNRLLLFKQIAKDVF